MECFFRKIGLKFRFTGKLFQRPGAETAKALDP